MSPTRRCECCGQPAFWVLEDERDGTAVRCAECGPPPGMEISTVGYCCDHCNGPLERFIRDQGPRHHRVYRSGDLLRRAALCDEQQLPYTMQYRIPDWSLPRAERDPVSLTVVLRLDAG